VAALALATGLGAYPLVRRLTRRLEALQTQVVALGRGELGARVAVEGRDEIADLAASFNQTAERIERLVEEKKSALATTSHELRTPLTRMRVALELMDGHERPELRERIERDIRELDALIGDLLVASRLDSPELTLSREPVDLLALLAEEAAVYEVEVTGESAPIDADPRLLRRMLGNLLENARRYGDGADRAQVTRSEDGWSIQVFDRGPGVPSDERERIFEPFYRPATREHQATLGEGGLGLALVRQIAERHGGRASCREREGGGSIFQVWLPARARA
jgi:signal transduction histidine kinase